MEPKKRPVGRPAGEPATVVNVRLPDTLIERLDRYVDRMEVETGISTNRGTIIRNALRAFLDARGY